MLADIETTDLFTVAHDVKQGCVPAPTLTAALDVADGVYLTTHTNGKLFNGQCLKAKTEVRQMCAWHSLDADDVGLVSHSIRDLQKLRDTFITASAAFGLSINI